MSISFLKGFSSTSFFALEPNLLCEEPGWVALGSTLSLAGAVVVVFFGAASKVFFLVYFLSSFFAFSFAAFAWISACCWAIT